MTNENTAIEPEIMHPPYERYFPHNEKEGKGIAYAAAGIGIAAAIGLIGYGVSSGIGTSGQVLKSCQKKYNAEVSLWNARQQQFINEDVANNVPFPTPTQQTSLNQINAQENSIAQTCFKENWVANSASIISEAFALGIVLVFGAVAYKYIKKRGYLKPPKTGSSGNASTPEGSNARVQMGIIDYLRVTGKLPTSWDNAGITSVNNIVAESKTQVQNFTSEMIQLNLMTTEEATAVIAAETTAIEESSLLVLAVLA